MAVDQEVRGERGAGRYPWGRRSPAGRIKLLEARAARLENDLARDLAAAIESGLVAVGLRAELAVAGGVIARMVEVGRQLAEARAYLSYEGELLDAQRVAFWLKRARSLGLELGAIDQRDVAVHRLFDAFVIGVTAHLAARRSVQTEDSGRENRGDQEVDGGELPAGALVVTAEASLEPPVREQEGVAATAVAAPYEVPDPHGDAGGHDGGEKGEASCAEPISPILEGPYVCLVRDQEIDVIWENPNYLRGVSHIARKRVLFPEDFDQAYAWQIGVIRENDGVLPDGWSLPEGAILTPEGEVIRP